MEKNEIIKRFAEVQKIDYETANTLIGAETDEEILKNISSYTINKINGGAPMNRAQRRAFMKKVGKKNKDNLSIVTETAQKLDYIDLIEKLRNLNKKQEEELKAYEDINEEN